MPIFDIKVIRKSYSANKHGTILIDAGFAEIKIDAPTIEQARQKAETEGPQLSYGKYRYSEHISSEFIPHKRGHAPYDDKYLITYEAEIPEPTDPNVPPSIEEMEDEILSSVNQPVIDHILRLLKQGKKKQAHKRLMKLEGHWLDPDTLSKVLDHWETKSNPDCCLCGDKLKKKGYRTPGGKWVCNACETWISPRLVQITKDHLNKMVKTASDPRYRTQALLKKISKTENRIKQLEKIRTGQTL